MKVSPISNKLVSSITDIKNSVAKKTNTKSASKVTASFSLLLVSGFNALLQKDTEYKKELLTNIGISPNEYYKIRSILSPGEIKKVLSELSPSAQNYTVGNNLENTKNGLYKANLHIHTVNSDGFFTTQELLDKAAEYGDSLKRINKHNPPFTIAITDHDTTEGIEEATRIIANSPEKYKNLRVIMGSEITTYDNIATDIVDFPTNAHILVYGFNPKEEKFKNFVDNTKTAKLEVARKMFETANDVYKSIYGTDSYFSIEEAKEFSTQLRESVTGMFNHVDKYIKTKFIMNEIVMKNEKICELITKQCKQNEIIKDMTSYYKPINRNNYIQTPEKIVKDYITARTGISEHEVSEIINKGLEMKSVKRFLNQLNSTFDAYKINFNPKFRYVPNFEMLNEALSNQPDVLVGIAHPLDYTKKISKETDAFKFIETLYSRFKEVFKKRALFCETYYQSYSKHLKEVNEKPQTIVLMKQLADKHGLYSSGGLDNHRNNLFRRY